MVHDAARPCLTEADVDRLIQTLSASAVGGLLAVPVADTLKRATAEGLVLDTQSREHLWQAQTPQMFRYQRLVDALARADLATVTDEASAIEQSGFQPQLVLGSAMNLKVTYPADQTLAELILLRFN
jgi:2-C-methyl-D-erythritol 4-phosphate cytidylyltransferase